MAAKKKPAVQLHNQGIIDDAIKAAARAATKKVKKVTTKVVSKKVTKVVKGKTTKKVVPTVAKKPPSKPMPDWSSLTPDERAFATTFNRNTPASAIKKAMIEHDMKLSRTTQKGIRDIAQTMAQKKGMDITRAYDFAESYAAAQRRGIRRPRSN